MNWSNQFQSGWMAARQTWLVAIYLSLLAFPADAETPRLTNDGLTKTSPTFVDRSGDELLYVVEDLPARMRIMRLRVADGQTEPIHPDVTQSEFEPACSLDGRMLSYVRSNGNLNLVLVIEEPAAVRETVLNVGTGFAGPRSPTFSPDSVRVIYSFADEGRQHLYAVGADGAGQRRFIDSSGLNNWPSFTPNGKQLVFGSSRDGDFEIYVAEADGTDVRRLTNSPAQDIRPRVSPDGRRIAFTSARNGNYEIYVMNLDGSGLLRITDHPERDDYPTWHPDGRRLVIVSEREGRQDLYRVDVPPS